MPTTEFELSIRMDTKEKKWMITKKREYLNVE